MNQTVIPEGYMQDQAGRLVPITAIKPIDLMRDKLVRDIVDAAQTASRMLGEFKRAVADDIAAFIELSAEEYGAKLGGKKGNVALLSFDRRYKVQIAVNDYIRFDERLQAAKALIDECIHLWSTGSNTNLMAIVGRAFKVDKVGNVNTGHVLGLRNLEITGAGEDKWKEAMRAINDAIQVVDSRSYIRVYERDDSGNYNQVALDLASVSL